MDSNQSDITESSMVPEATTIPSASATVFPLDMPTTKNHSASVQKLAPTGAIKTPSQASVQSTVPDLPSLIAPVDSGTEQKKDLKRDNGQQQQVASGGDDVQVKWRHRPTSAPSPKRYML